MLATVSFVDAVQPLQCNELCLMQPYPFLVHSWPNDEIIERMADSGYRIAGNEWENFDVSRHFDLPAVFATSFRKPLDRALSQFRFECIEDRGCAIKDVHTWWAKRSDLWKYSKVRLKNAD